MKCIVTDQRVLSLYRRRNSNFFQAWGRKTHRRTLIALLICLSCSGLGFSETAFADNDYRRDRGLYLGVGAGLGYLNPNDDRAEIRVEEQKDTAGQIFLGLDLGHRFGVETSYAQLGTADLSDGATLRYREASISGLVYGFNTKENREKREGLYGYGRVGAGRLYTKAEGVDHRQDNDYHLLLGAGAEYGFTNGFALRGEYLSYDHDAKSVQLALLYRFSKNSESDPTPVIPTPEPDPIAVTSSDTDQDDVPDNVDLCTDTAPGMKVDADGCPIYNDKIEGVNFVTNSAELIPSARSILDEAAANLQKFPHIAIKIMAHTDSRGPATYNLDLSMRRAASVATYLLSRGIEKARLIPQAYGETFPIAPNSTPQGRFKNRRVEFDTYSQP